MNPKSNHDIDREVSKVSHTFHSKFGKENIYKDIWDKGRICNIDGTNRDQWRNCWSEIFISAMEIINEHK